MADNIRNLFDIPSNFLDLNDFFSSLGVDNFNDPVGAVTEIASIVDSISKELGIKLRIGFGAHMIDSDEEYTFIHVPIINENGDYIDDIFVGLKGHIDSRATLIYSTPEDVRNNSYEIRNGIIQGVKYFES